MAEAFFAGITSIAQYLGAWAVAFGVLILAIAAYAILATLGPMLWALLFGKNR